MTSEIFRLLRLYRDRARQTRNVESQERAYAHTHTFLETGTRTQWITGAQTALSAALWRTMKAALAGYGCHFLFPSGDRFQSGEVIGSFNERSRDESLELAK